jgi:hypothetical protein
MSSREDFLGTLVGAVIAATALTLAGVVGYQVLDWLKTGVWTEFPISRIAGPVGALEWKGLQKIIEFLFSLHIGFLIVIVGWFLGWALFSFFERISRPLPPRRP